jgi:hypothetical protein
MEKVLDTHDDSTKLLNLQKFYIYNWNFCICKNYQAFRRRKYWYSGMSFGVKETKQELQNLNGNATHKCKI